MFFKKFFEWFRKNTKNKIIVFSIVFIFSLGYSFLHRPLGLIIWDSFYFSKENEQIKMITNYMDDEEKFLKTYKQYHIANKFEKTQEELFKYIDDFEIDLLASPQGHNPSAVAFDTISKACAKGFDRVIIDTAGRLQNQKN